MSLWNHVLIKKSILYTILGQQNCLWAVQLFKVRIFGTAGPRFIAGMIHNNEKVK